jgi:hypothetical protein
MNEQQETNYKRIARVIDYLDEPDCCLFEIEV